MDYKELIDRLTTDREWTQANEWESPICLQDDLSAAIAVVENYSQITEWLRANGFESFEALTEAFEQVKRERDAAVEDLELIAEQCYFQANMYQCAYCGNYLRIRKGYCGGCDEVNGFIWRGPQKEE